MIPVDLRDQTRQQQATMPLYCPVESDLGRPVARMFHLEFAELVSVGIKDRNLSTELPWKAARVGRAGQFFQVIGESTGVTGNLRRGVDTAGLGCVKAPALCDTITAA